MILTRYTGGDLDHRVSELGSIRYQSIIPQYQSCYLVLYRGDNADPLTLCRARLPVRMNGWGLRSQLWVAPTALMYLNL